MAELTQEIFEDIYNKALIMCSIKCHNEHVRSKIKLYRELKELKELNNKRLMDDLKEQLKRSYYDCYCYECSCSPDRKYMYKLIKKVVDL